jgi:hypothetical protein
MTGARAGGAYPVAIVSLFLAAVVLSSCGTSSPSKSSAAITSACTHVTNALADGPDPDSDPIGYAEAQIIPLGRIVVSDHTLQRAIAKLDDAYKKVFQTNAAAGTSNAAKEALRTVDRLCKVTNS